MSFLSPAEIDALLAAPDRDTWIGRRDHALIATGIQTGLRVIATLTCLSFLAFGQTDANKGQIVGSVYDANKALVPGAKVKLTNTATGFSRDIVAGFPDAYLYHLGSLR